MVMNSSRIEPDMKLLDKSGPQSVIQDATTKARGSKKRNSSSCCRVLWPIHRFTNRPDGPRGVVHRAAERPGASFAPIACGASCDRDPSTEICGETEGGRWLMAHEAISHRRGGRVRGFTCGAPR